VVKLTHTNDTTFQHHLSFGMSIAYIELMALFLHTGIIHAYMRTCARSKIHATLFFIASIMPNRKST